MKYNEKLAKLTLIPSKDKSRYSINDLYLDVDAGILVATDGWRLVVHKVKVDPKDVSGNVSVEALKALGKAWKTHKLAKVRLDCSKTDVVSVMCGENIYYSDERSSSQFPNWRAVLPTHGISEDGAMTLSLNSKLLYEMSQAMGGTEDIVTLSIKDSQTAITILKGHEVLGVLMPYRNNQKRVSKVFWQKNNETELRQS